MTMQQHVFSIAQSCELAGVSEAIICPGSRSAPLVYAFTHSNITCHSVVDERSAAYMALGMAQQNNKPVVLICTSGTASLNFFPAIAEAFYQQIPLLILTADRPPELLNQQDGQMIMQKDVYGKHVKGSYELPCYEPGKENLTETRKLIDEALLKCVSGTPGPVHVNIPLSEPLYPTKPFSALKARAGADLFSINKPSLPNFPTILNLWKKATRKLILVGQMPPNAQLTSALHELQSHEDVVVVCDVLSNQYVYNTASQFDYLVLRADTETLNELRPDLIISLGGPVLSKSLKNWLKSFRPEVHIRFNTEGTNIDTYQNRTHAFTDNAAASLFELGLHHKQKNSGTRHKQFWQQADFIISQATQHHLKQAPWSELLAMFLLLNKIPDATNIQVGNSSIIRYMSYLGSVNPSWILNGNRGTSGIDGCTSTAVGAAMVNNRPTLLLTGDIAFLYDINALWNPLPPNLKIVVFNNEGGGIFELIEGPRKQPKQLPYFTTPHQQDISALCAAKKINHWYASEEKGFNKILVSFLNPTTPAGILEIRFNRNDNSKAFEAFKRMAL